MATGAASKDFDGTANGYVTMGAMTALDGATEASWCCWHNPQTLAADKSLFSEYQTFFLSNWYHSTEASTWNLTTVSSAGGGRVVRSSDAMTTLFSTGNWYFDCWTWKSNADDITDYKFYVDGVSKGIGLVYNVGSMTALNNLAENYEIGTLTPGTFDIDSKIAYVSIYDRQLSQAEAQEIHRNPWAITDGLVSMVPLYSATAQDLVSGDTADATGSGATADSLGPPVFFLGSL